MREMRDLQRRINELPRVQLANLPTPLEEMPRLSEALGGPRLLIKRDDYTGLAFGGNKVRKLEFEMADALKKGADVIVTSGLLQSNHARSTTVAARKLGMGVVLILREEEPEEYDGNLLLDYIFGADVRFVRVEWAELGRVTRKIFEELRGEGHTPYFVPFSSPLGSVGYVNAVLELLEQAESRGMRIDRIVHAAGSGGTQAGLVVGTMALEAGIGVVGVSVEPDFDWLLKETVEIANGCAELLGLDVSVSAGDVTLLGDYVGEGYGVVTKEVVKAVRLVAEKEGILLDPVYTGKAMAGLVDLVGQGYFDRGETVVFLHTGGTPAVFAYGDELRSR